LSDALDKLGISGVMNGVYPVCDGAKLAGAAFTVKGIVGNYAFEDFAIGQVIDSAKRGEAIVIDLGGHRVSSWGGLASASARLKGIAGVVVDGAVRDVDEIRAMKYPVFARHVAPISGKRRVKIVSVGEAVSCGGITVQPLDLVVGDGTGVAVVPRERVQELLEIARSIEEKEGKIRREIKRGASFSEVARKYSHI